jgi:hypothetical protein
VSQDSDLPKSEGMARVYLQDDGAFFSMKLWLGWTRWTWVRLAFASIVLLNVLGFFRLQENGNDDKERQAKQDQAQLDSSYRQCLSSNDGRSVLLSLVEKSTQQGFNPSAIPSFQNLDTATKQFFLDLAAGNVAASQDTNPDSFINQARKLLTLRDCEAEFPTHTR